MRKGLLCVAVSALTACGAASARDGVFNFESNAASANTYGPFIGGYGYLTDSSGGVNLTLSRTSVGVFDVMDTSGQFAPYLFPAGWGSHVLAPFINTGDDFFNANFTGAAVTGVSIEFGDFGGDSGDVSFEVWSGADGTGTLLFSTTVFYDGNFNDDGGPFSFGYAGPGAIGSFRFKGEGTDFPQSLYWDNLVANTGGIVPLPTAAGLALAGLSAVGLRRRR